MMMRTTAVALLGLAMCGPLALHARAQSADQPGDHILVQFEDLPAPAPGSGAMNPPDIVDRSAQDHLTVPPGFSVNLFADGLAHPRWMTVAPNGDVLLAETREGRITLLRDADGDGVAEQRETFASGYQRPHGMAFEGDYLYIADLQAVWRVPYQDGALSVRGREPVTPRGALGAPNGHWTRGLVFSPDGAYFYVAIGSRSNLSEEPVPRATVQRFRRDGTDQTTYTGGLRNPVGMAIYPGTDEVYVVVNERDGYGDDLVPDYLTRIQEGQFFGWPYAYLGPHADPEFGALRPDLVEATERPDVLFEAHSAPLGLVFYTRDQFPERFRGGAFVAHHGSWNRGTPQGYRVVYVPFEDTRPAGGYEVFATGFWREGVEPAQVWGRPVGLAIASDGSLLVADDAGQAVWRISYTGEQ